MGRAMRWLRKLLNGGGGKKEGAKEQSAAAPPIERRRWSFAKARSSVADASRRPSVTAVVAGELSQSQARPCGCGQARETEAAVLIQKAFRGYLARKALRALKSLVKLQALVRGYLVRKQAATTLHRLQALMRLQASSQALKNLSSRRSIEQERKTSAPVAHRRRLSEGGAGDDRSPRIVEMDTCQLRSRSSRIAGRFAAADPQPQPPPLSSPLAYFCKPPSRLQLRELEPRQPKTTQNTPRLPAIVPGGSPAKGRPSCGGGRESSSPRYMAETASSVARGRCQSAPRQRHGNNAAGSRKAAPQSQDSFSFKSSDATSRVEDYSEMSDEVTRDYYLDQLW
ncbi:unnamed protein product [Triticum turgidum subsp. durum]|uniref:DUF4005 domain-containing protein n=1 Tax=Triticum turgidum subsp. durum TaxID=4567 RepID=A0A9R0VCZ5_TRITD|nr:unnamed protein product [Triticum turgidum subsp. durum]